MGCSDLTRLSCNDFTDLLASKEPVPGGGGAAALVGALGVALGSMVGEYTVGKKKYEGVSEEIESLLKEASTIRKKLLELIEEDAKGFEPLSRAYSIPKDDPSREEVLEEATRNAIKAPLHMVEYMAKALDIIRVMQLKGSVMLVSDAGCGAALCKAAMQSAAMNVYINTKSLKDRAFAKETEDIVDGILEKYLPLAETIVTEVTTSLRS